MVRYQAVSFDAGFTLIEPVQHTGEVARAVVRAAGFDIGQAAFEHGMRAAEQFFFAGYEAHGNDDWTSDDRILQLWNRYYGIFFTALELPGDSHIELTMQVIAHYSAADNWRPYPETRAVLAELHGRGYPLGVISDWDSRLPGILAHLGLLDAFGFVLASGATGLAKPRADFYRMAPRLAGVAPEAMIHIGDSFFADVSGARAAGMHGVLLDRAGANLLVNCPVVRDLWGLVVILEESR